MKLFLILSIWICFTFVFNFFRPGVWVPFKNYSFSLYNIVERRLTHIDFLKLFWFYSYFVFIYVLSFFVVCIYYPILINLSFLSYIFFIFFIFIKILKKQSFTLYNFSSKISSDVTMFNCLMYTFFYQPIFVGSSLAYNTIKILYKKDKFSIKTYINYLLEFLKIIFVGCSFFFLSMIKTLSLIILTSINDVQLSKKKNKLFVFLRLLIVKIYDNHICVYNYHRICSENNIIFFDEAIKFNPPRPRTGSFDILKSKKSNIYKDDIFNIHKSSHAKHLSLNIDGDLHTNALLTTSSLEDQELVQGYSPKKTGGLVYNTIIDPNAFLDNYSGFGNVIRTSGLHDPFYCDFMKNSVIVMRDMAVKNNVLIQSGVGKKIIHQKKEDTNYHLERLNYEKEMGYESPNKELTLIKSKGIKDLIDCNSKILDSRNEALANFNKRFIHRSNSSLIESGVKNDSFEETYIENKTPLKNSPLKKTSSSPMFITEKVSNEKDFKYNLEENIHNSANNKNEPMKISVLENNQVSVDFYKKKEGDFDLDQ